MKRTLKLAIPFLSVALTFTVIEVSLRAVEPFEKQRKRYMRTRNIFQYDKRNVQYDEMLGFIPKADLVASFHNQEFNIKIKTNSMGFRDDQNSLRNPDILILGDSFGFGWGVDKDKTCEAYLEDETGLKALNMCVPGYGTAQEYLLLAKWGYNRRLKGKTVIFLFYMNDIVENLGFGFEVFPAIVPERGGIRLSRSTREGFKKWLHACNASMYRGIFRTSYFAYKCRKALLQMKERITPDENSYIPEGDKFEAFGAIAKEIKRLADREGFNVVFVWIPSIKYYEEGNATYAGTSENDIYSFVENALSRVSIPLIDLRQALERDDYYALDSHWKSSGHHKAAIEIGKFLNIGLSDYKL